VLAVCAVVAGVAVARAARAHAMPTADEAIHGAAAHRLAADALEPGLALAPAVVAEAVARAVVRAARLDEHLGGRVGVMRDAWRALLDRLCAIGATPSRVTDAGAADARAVARASVGARVAGRAGDALVAGLAEADAVLAEAVVVAV
jgi:hypothetical protein